MEFLPNEIENIIKYYVIWSSFTFANGTQSKQVFKMVNDFKQIWKMIPEDLLENLEIVRTEYVEHGHQNRVSLRKIQLGETEHLEILQP